MKNRMMIGLIAVVIVLALPGLSLAGVDVNISIPLFDLLGAGVYVAGPPVVYAPAPPVYYAPAPVEGAMFYGGFWYRPSNGNWFVAAQAGGPWTMVAVESVPYAVISGPVLMNRAPTPAYGYGSVGVGIGIGPGYRQGHGWHGRGRGGDDD